MGVWELVLLKKRVRLMHIEKPKTKTLKKMQDGRLSPDVEGNRAQRRAAKKTKKAKKCHCLGIVHIDTCPEWELPF